MRSMLIVAAALCAAGHAQGHPLRPAASQGLFPGEWRARAGWTGSPSGLSALRMLVGVADAFLEDPRPPRGGAPPSGEGSARGRPARRSIEGVVREMDLAKKTLVIVTKRGESIPVDAALGSIRAGKRETALAELQPGDRVRVRGEVTVLGGIRSMEITLRETHRPQAAPAAAASSPPPPAER